MSRIVPMLLLVTLLRPASPDTPKAELEKPAQTAAEKPKETVPANSEKPKEVATAATEKPADAAKPAQVESPKTAVTSESPKTAAKGGTNEAQPQPATTPDAPAPPRPAQEFAPETIELPRLGLVIGQGGDKEIGVAVVQVPQGSPAWDQGFRPGDRVLRFAGRAVNQARDLARLEAMQLEPVVEMIIRREGRDYRAVTSLMPTSMPAHMPTAMPTSMPARAYTFAPPAGVVVNNNSNLTINSNGATLSLKGSNGICRLEYSGIDAKGQPRQIRVAGTLEEIRPYLDRLPSDLRDAAHRHLNGEPAAMPAPPVSFPFGPAFYR